MKEGRSDFYTRISFATTKRSSHSFSLPFSPFYNSNSQIGARLSLPLSFSSHSVIAGHFPRFCFVLFDTNNKPRKRYLYISLLTMIIIIFPLSFSSLSQWRILLFQVGPFCHSWPLIEALASSSAFSITIPKFSVKQSQNCPFLHHLHSLQWFGVHQNFLSKQKKAALRARDLKKGEKERFLPDKWTKVGWWKSFRWNEAENFVKTWMKVEVSGMKRRIKVASLVVGMIRRWCV